MMECKTRRAPNVRVNLIADEQSHDASSDRIRYVDATPGYAAPKGE